MGTRCLMSSSLLFDSVYNSAWNIVGTKIFVHKINIIQLFTLYMHIIYRGSMSILAGRYLKNKLIIVINLNYMDL